MFAPSGYGAVTRLYSTGRSLPVMSAYPPKRRHIVGGGQQLDTSAPGVKGLLALLQILRMVVMRQHTRHDMVEDAFSDEWLYA